MGCGHSLGRCGPWQCYGGPSMPPFASVKTCGGALSSLGAPHSSHYTAQAHPKDLPAQVFPKVPLSSPSAPQGPHYPAQLRPAFPIIHPRRAPRSPCPHRSAHLALALALALTRCGLKISCLGSMLRCHYTYNDNDKYDNTATATSDDKYKHK